MGIGTGDAMKTASPSDAGPKPADMSKHVTGSGDRPGTGSASSAPTPQHPANKGKA